VIHFNCPACNCLVSAPEEKIGQKGACPSCRQPLTVPAATPALATAGSATKGAGPEIAQPMVDEVAVDLDMADLEDLEEPLEPAPSTRGLLIISIGSAIAVIAAILFFSTGLWQYALAGPLTSLARTWGLSPVLGTVAATLILFIAFAVPLVILVADVIKLNLLAHLPDQLDWQPIDPDETPGIDYAALAQLTAEFEALGFRQAIDNQITHKYEERETAFSRLFVHPEHHCFAELSEVVRADGTASPIRFLILSRLTHGWSLTSGNREWDTIKTTWLWRQPKVLWSSHPGRSTAEVLQAHLERRKQIMHDLGAEVQTDMCPRVYFEHEQEGCVRRKQALRQRSAIAILRELPSLKEPRSHWDGACPTASKTRT
jgi:hypothetical protein